MTDTTGQSAQSAALLSQGSGSPGPGSVASNFFNQGQFKIDKNTGAARISYPIVIPPGRNNLQPNLDLLYNSQDSQQGSIWGEGWSISIPYIERMNKNGIDAFYGSSSIKYYASSIDGELSTTTASSSYIARTENGSFNRYAFNGSQWTLTDKSGTQYVFGSTSSSQQTDPINPSNTYRWMLAQVTDTNGNSISYNYFKDSGQIYPSSTVYTNSSSSAGIFEVDFLRTSSTDNGTSSATGFTVNSNYRIGEIDAKVNGTWVRKYVLGYTTGDNGKTALLSSVVESGQNASGTVVTLPTSTFSYQTQTTGWVNNAAWEPLISFTASSSADNGVRVADVNGDGLPDIVQGWTNSNGSTTFAAYVNNGAGWTVSSTWKPPLVFVSSTVDMGVRIVDVNGDALPDYIQAYNDGSNHFTSYVNNGHGWTATSTWNPPVTFATNGVDAGARVADVNGDGLPDIIQAYTDAGGASHFASYINNGNGWTSSATWNAPAIFLASSTTDTGARIVDVNGDGLPDIIQGYNDGSNHFAAYLNTGNGWSASSTALWNSPVVFVTNGVDQGTRVADVNGDGLADILQAYTDGGGTPHYAAYLNTGAGWTSASSWNPPVTFTLNGTDNGTRIVDANGDGLPDILQAYTDASSTTHFAAYTNNNRFRADLLSGITYPQGGSSAISYQSILQLTDDLGNVLNGVPYPVYIVSKLTANDGTRNVATSTYVYYGGSYYVGGPFDHQFAGFTQVKETDPAGNITKTYYDTGIGTSSSTGQYQDNFWKIGKPYRIENYDSASNLYRVVINGWDSYALGGNAGFVKLATTTELDYDGLLTHSDKAESYAYDNTTGNQTQKIQWGQVTAANDGSFTDTGTDKFTTALSYATSSAGAIGLPSDITITDQSGSKVKETRYYYDTLALGSASVGNLTKQEDWKTSNTYINTQNTYDSYGLVTQHLDSRGKQTNYEYDAYHLYAATTTNALSQTTGYQYDYSSGRVTQTVDPNGSVFRTTYDGMDRPLQLSQPDPSATSTQVAKTVYVYTDTANAVSVKQSDYLDASTTVDTYTYYDGLGRPIQTRKSSEDVGIYKVADKGYNALGLLQRESLPYFASGAAKTVATSTAALFIAYTYDPLQRVLTTTNAVGTTSYAYANWKTTTTDARGKPKDQYTDAYGNLVRVDEHNGTSTYATYYTYDGLKDLTSITDALSNVRNFSYDGLGRRITAQDLHASADTTYGTSTYAYDDAGNLTQTIDAKSQTVNYTYDDLGRILTEDYTGQAGTEFSYSYDTCTQGIGRLCVASSSDVVTSKTYNALGQLVQEAKTIASTTYTTSYTYDRQGNQLTITNPDSSQVQYTYNSAGLVETVAEKESGAGGFTSIISDFDYAPTDQVAAETYATGMVAKNIYDPLRLYRLVGKVTTTGGGEEMLFDGGEGGGGMSLLDGSDGLITTSTVTLPYTGAVATYTVPSDVTSLTITLYGAQGATSTLTGSGGLGGKVVGTLAVASGTTYYIKVGGMNGYSGGGAGAGCYSGCAQVTYSGGNGGGFTSFALSSTTATSTVLLLAGGGGGAGGGNGGSGGGASGLGGANGGAASRDGAGGAGATQSAGGSGGSGGTSNGLSGTAGSLFTGGVGGGSYIGGASAGAGGGGGGFYGGGGGGGGGFNVGPGNGGAGAGGASFIAATSSLTGTSTTAGVNSGDGYIVIIENHDPVYAPTISSFNQYLLNGTTTINRGSSTYETGVVLGAMLNSSGTQNLKLQAEVEPIGRNFTNIPNVTSSAFMSPNQVATTSFYGLSGTSYHWQARAVDALGNPSEWVRFSSSTFTTDFTLKYFQVITTSTYSGSVASYTVPAGVTKLVISLYGAQGASSGGLGGAVTGTLLVTPGSVYYFNVGGQGGYSGGGTAGTGGGSGGGMTWFSASSTFSTSTVIMVAGGGGGSGTGSTGGGGGGTTGTAASDVNNGFSSHGGGGGTQTAGGTGGATGSFGGGTAGTNGAAGTGGNGGNGANGSIVHGGGGGGGGFYGGGGGSGGANNGGTLQSAGGGGGSSFILATSTLISTSTASGVNSGNGSITIVGLIAPKLTLGSLNQYRADGTTPLPAGDSTNDGKVVFGATLNSEATSSVQLEVEVRSVSAGTSSTQELYATSLYSDSDLLSYYRLSGNSNDSKNAHNGSDTSISYGSSYGKFGQGASFGGSNSKITASNAGITGHTPFSVSTWVKTGSTTLDMAPWTFGYFQTDSAGFGLFVNSDVNGVGSLMVNTAGPHVVATPTSSFPLNAWNNVVVTYDGTNLSGVKIYVNGSQVSTTVSGNGTPNIANNDVYIGSYHAASDGGFFSGSQDDPAIFGRVLTPAEVAYLYESAIPGFANAANVTSSALVTPGSFATTSFQGPIGDYRWQARMIDPANNGWSDWQLFGGGSTSTDFGLSPILFTFPTNGTTTATFSNWQLNATNVTSSNSYKIQVGWGIAGTSEASSSVNASGTQLLSGVNVPKMLYSGDYSDAGTPIRMTGLASLYDITSGTSTFIATTTVNFYEQTIPATSNCDGSDIQCIGYTYDANGNITKIVENASTSAARVVDYTYDDLNRLVTASSSNVASGSNYRQTFSYNAIGNITSGPLGTYSYQGNQSSSYANPHAVTSIALGTSTTNFAYDNNGNLTSSGNATHTWNYRNYLTQSVLQNGSSTYAYDYLGQRIKLREGSSTTIFPTALYNVTGSSTVKHLMANGMVIGTIESGTIRYALTDSLSGTNLITDDTGSIVETLDYYPYGALRVDGKSGDYQGETRKYIGQEYDAGTQLSYLNARYYDIARGQFVSQDPIFWGAQNLGEPQSLNSYAYANANPISKSDPSGRVALVDDSVILGTIAIVATTPIWMPAVSKAGNALYSGITSLARYSDSWARSNERQIQNININSEFDEGGFLPNNKEPDDDNWKKWGLIGIGSTVLGGGAYEAFQEFGESIPKINVGGGGVSGSNNNSYLTQQLPVNSSSASRSGQSGPLQGNGSGGNSPGGLSQQQLQNIQSQLNAIQNAINQIRQQINVKN